jgi:DNA-binding transcriptional LysR family regulator
VDISSRQIEAFRMVMLTGSITGASEALFVTQPAVSRLIQSLEDTTGLKLFERRGNQIVPTA